MNRLSLILLSLSCLLLINVSKAQDQMQYKLYFDSKHTDRGFEITCRNNSEVFGRFSIYILFEDLHNIKHPLQFMSVISAGSHITTLPAYNPQTPYSIGSYRYNYTRGVYNIDINENIVYRIPFTSSKRVHVGHLLDASPYMGRPMKDTLRGFVFRAQQGDTVYASRRGEVVELVDDKDLTFEHGAMYKEGTTFGNYVIIEHKDGSLARYSLLAYKHIFVKKGDLVYPDTPIGLVGTRDGLSYKMHLIISSIYRDYTIKEGVDIFRHKYHMPKFATDNGAQMLLSGEQYVVVEDQAVTRAEMSKREIKKRYE